LCISDVGVTGAAAADSTATRGDTAISPTLVPESDKKFFGKDFPNDKRPKVDVFHFKHPYPAVQDSNDYDSDFVKDENNDNGEWKAQTEYDRLRHKLAKEKADVAKALEAKRQAEKELQDATRRGREVQRQVEEAAKRKRVVVKRKAASKDRDDEKPTTTWIPAIPEIFPAPGDIEAATADTKRAMDALEECKKQLAEAREKLKRLMKELEEAKKLQDETQKALDAALSRQKEAEVGQKSLDKSVQTEYQEYLDAREAYLKQQALIAKMENEIQVAAEKVKAVRDAEDNGGGVYNSDAPKSAAPASAMPTSTLMVLLAAFGLSVA